MDVASLTFVVFALGAALLFHAAPNPLYRKLILTGANLCFIASYLTVADRYSLTLFPRRSIALAPIALHIVKTIVPSVRPARLTSWVVAVHRN